MADGFAVNLLLDTCAVIGLALGNLPSASLNALQSADEAVISPIVPWELAIKQKSGKLSLSLPPLDWVNALAARYRLDPPTGGLDAALLCLAADLPLIHRDPFDRVLVATALRRNLVIVTADSMLSSYPNVVTIW